ncbi:hypothetical protein DEO72_LG5g2470 [Vigna unguiculata]|uniref:DDT domain-containing protein n=1 Tax=Vigna unguiculata TaxID=3917 RepID=A0A4D6M0H5_VIGUN|nr:hypothetical protein DEO72_LG5g2470 [Vigna unguiculata]
MDVRFSSAQTKNSQENVVASPPIQIGGKSCHQCRQKKENFLAICKNLKKGKNCPVKFCHKCLSARYGENAEEVAALADWICPKCRGVCNCSLCQKRRGEVPTGQMYRSAKESGFKSVAEMLAFKKASKALNPSSDGSLKEVSYFSTYPLSKISWLTDLVKRDLLFDLFFSGELGKASCSDANDLTDVCNRDHGGDNVGTILQRFPNVGMNLECKIIEEEVLLPRGIELKEIYGMELQPKDVGNALQFLEFCRVFGKALDLKEEEAKAIFEELISEESMDEHNSSLIQFHIKLLALILSDSEKESQSLLTKSETNSWIKHLEGLMMQSHHILNDFPVNWFQEGISGYFKLDLSKKFRLMTFLCDEVLNTEKLRRYIQDENTKQTKRVKEAKLKIAAAKEKVKCLRQRLRNEKAKVSPCPMEECDALIDIRTQVDEAHTDMLSLKSTNQKESGSDATRINPEFVDNNGMTFWNLRSYNEESVVLRQDLKVQDEAVTSPEESWFVYSPKEKDEVDKYISSRAKRRKNSQIIA